MMLHKFPIRGSQSCIVDLFTRETKWLVELETELSIIVAVSRNGVIGNKGHLPWPRVPKDMKWFRDNTLNKPLIVGRKTFESWSQPLSNRPTFVITRDPEYASVTVPNVTVCNSLGMAVALASNYPEIMVCGGAEIYRQALPLASNLYYTIIDQKYEGDTYFPIDILDHEFGVPDPMLRPVYPPATPEPIETEIRPGVYRYDMFSISQFDPEGEAPGGEFCTTSRERRQLVLNLSKDPWEITAV